MIRLLTFAFLAGEDALGRAATARGQRLRDLVKLDPPPDHMPTLRFDRGVSAVASTFG